MGATGAISGSGLPASKPANIFFANTGSIKKEDEKLKAKVTELTETERKVRGEIQLIKAKIEGMKVLWAEIDKLVEDMKNINKQRQLLINKLATENEAIKKETQLLKQRGSF